MDAKDKPSFSLRLSFPTSANLLIHSCKVTVMKNIIGLDTETVLQKGSHQFLSAQFYCPELNLNDFVTDPEVLHKYFTSKTRGSIFIAQNAEYDFLVFRKTLGFPLSRKDTHTSYIFKCLYNKGNFVYGKILRSGHVWKVWDLRNIFVGWNLKRIGNLIGCPKLEKPDYLGLREPNSVKEWVYFKKYAMRDAEICYKASKWVISRLGMLKMTLPSLSFAIYNDRYKPYGVYLNIPSSLERKLRLAYKGGRVESFIRGTPDKPVFVYDADSLYPYIMWKNKMPLGFEGVKHKTTIDLSREGVACCTVKQDAEIPLLCLKMFTKDGNYKLMFPNGKFTSWFTYPELRIFEWKGLGKIFNVKEAYEVKESACIFTRFVNDYYELKKVDVEGKDFWKIFLNSLSGKFGQNATSPELTLMEKNLKVNKPRKTFKQNNILIASYIPALARINMHKYYQNIGLENLYYTDTDSVHTSVSLFDFSENLRHNLGDLVLKGKTDGSGRATYIRSKFYLFNDVLKCKGLQYVVRANEMRKLIQMGNVEVLTTILLKARSAFSWHKPLLTETKMIKRFSLEPDGKRVYEKTLKGKELLEDWCKSKAVVLNGLE